MQRTKYFPINSGQSKPQHFYACWNAALDRQHLEQMKQRFWAALLALLMNQERNSAIREWRKSKVYRLILLMAPLAFIVSSPASAASSTAAAIQARIQTAGMKPNSQGFVTNVADLMTFYEKRGFRPAWVGETRAGPRAREALAVIAGAKTEGLDPNDYAVQEIDARMTPQTPDERAVLDLMLSSALADYGADLQSGRVAASAGDAGGTIYASMPRPLVSALLAGAHEARILSSYFAKLGPQSPRYRRLRGALADYRKIALQGGWSAVSAGPSLRRGMTGDRVAELRRRLATSNDYLRPFRVGTLFGRELEAAVQRFQQRHGLAADGIVGPKTRAALNMPVDHRLQQIRLNLERRRLLPANLGRRYIFVNTADFLLKLVDEEKTVLDMRVVVGTPYRRTPVFSAKMTYLEFNPFWNIPPRIAREEIVPRVRRDPSHLQEQGIRIFGGWSARADELIPGQVKWANAENAHFPYRLRQDPGPRNPLGRVKFMFPNRFDVYLHDTPSRDLFDHDIRAFSHGCIRVEKPVALAAYLLRPDGDWPEVRVREIMEAAKTRRVLLARPIPVHISYLTAWVNKDGSVHFRKDIYGRDRLLTSALKRSFHAPPP